VPDAAGQLIPGIGVEQANAVFAIAEKHAAAHGQAVPDIAVGITTRRTDRPHGATCPQSRIGDDQQPGCPGNAFSVIAIQIERRSC
jgi:hypothetical protein